MIKKTLFVLLAAFTIFSCQKKDTTPAVPVTQDVEFSIAEIDPSGGQKSTDDWICKDLVADYVQVDIKDAGGTTNSYFPLVFRLNGVLYTQAIKLPTGDYSVENFLLMDDSGTPGDTSDDVIVMATPLSTSTYAPYVAYPLSYAFTVGEFTKVEVPIDVLCFLDVVYDKFGFNWFAVTEIVIREFCLFGDVCLNGDPWMPNHFNGSQYGNDLGIDVPAIMQVVVQNDGVDVAIPVFTNFDNHIGAPLCVQYPDNLNIAGEDFTFDIYLWLPDANGDFDYQLYYTLTATDDGPLSVDAGADKVIDFVLGSCDYEDADFNVNWLVTCPPAFLQGFETDTDYWFGGAGYGAITRTISATASKGGYVAVIEETPDESGPYTRFDGYRDVWPTGGWRAEVDFFIDPTLWSNGEGFDYSVAATGSDGAHQRDYIFHIAKQASGEVWVGGSNNTNFNPRMDLAAAGNYEIETSGWYTLQHVFYDNGGELHCDLNLLASDGTILNTITTLPTAGGDDIIANIGGNRYGWFTCIEVSGGIQIDEVQLFWPCN